MSVKAYERHKSIFYSNQNMPSHHFLKIAQNDKFNLGNSISRQHEVNVFFRQVLTIMHTGGEVQ